MSAGDFKSDAIYEMDNGSFTTVKLQPETISATIGGTANAEGAGPVTAGFPSALVSRGNSQIGIRPRFVSCKWVTPPTGYTSKTFKLPVLDKTLFDTVTKGDAVSYLGGTGTVLFKVAESVR